MPVDDVSSLLDFIFNRVEELFCTSVSSNVEINARLRFIVSRGYLYLILIYDPTLVLLIPTVMTIALFDNVVDGQVLKTSGLRD